MGRERQLRSVAEAVETAVRGHGRYVAIIGAAGIGKTTLAETAVASAPADAVICRGRTFNLEGGRPFAVWVDALAPYLADLGAPAAVRLLGPRNPLARLFPPLQRSISDLPGIPEADTASEVEGGRGNLAASFEDLFRRMSRNAPVIILLDDLHHADTPSIELLHYLCRQLVAEGVALVVTCRPFAEAGTGSALAACITSLRRQDLLHEIHLGPFSEAETATFVQTVTPRTVPAPVVARLHALSAGNPLLLQELVKELIAAVPEPSQWTPAAMRSVPPTVVEMVENRSSRLTAGARTVLAVAAVAGDSASFSLLAEVSGLPVDLQLAAVEELVQAQFLREVSGGPSLRYRFVHPLIGESAYLALSETRRAHLHSLCGRALIRLDPSDVAPFEVARHLLAAPDRLTRRSAIPHLLLASDQAVSVFAAGDASRCLERALEVVGDDEEPAVRLSIHERLAQTYEREGRLARALVQGELGLQLAADPMDFARIHRRMARVAWRRGQEQSALDHLTAGLGALQGEIPSGEEADLRQEYALIRQRLGDADVAIAQATKARDLAEAVGAWDVAARAGIVLLATFGAIGDMEQAFRHGEPALEIAESGNMLAVAWLGHYTTGALQRCVGKYEEGVEHLEQSLALAQALQAPALQSWPLCGLCEIYYLVGEWDRAIAAGEQAIALDRYSGQTSMLPRALASTSIIHRLRGEKALAAGYQQEAEDLVGHSDRKEVRISSVVAGAGAYLAYLDGNIELSIATSVQQTSEIDKRGGFSIYLVHPLCLPLAAEVLLAVGESDQAHRVVQRLEVISTTWGNKAGLAYVTRLRGLQAMHDDQVVRAVALLDQARIRFEDLRRPADVAAVHVDLANCYSSAHDTPSAIQNLRIAHGIYVRLQDNHHRDAVIGALRGLGARAPGRRPRPANGLSARELEVCRLVAQGLSNKEIGGRLNISVLTAETHVRNILGKLKLRSRAELAARTVGGALE